MANININAKLFYEDEKYKIHSIIDKNEGRYFLMIPTEFYNNFLDFMSLKYTSSIAISITDEMTNNINKLITHLNNYYNDLEEIPFFCEYEEIKEVIEKNFKKLINPKIKSKSIDEVIKYLSTIEKDFSFLDWLKEKLNKENIKNYNELKEDYFLEKLPYDITEYKEEVKNNEKYIIGPTTKNEAVKFKIPTHYDILKIFEMEYNTIDKKILEQFNKKQISRILYDKTISDLTEMNINQRKKENNNNSGFIELVTTILFIISGIISIISLILIF